MHCPIADLPLARSWVQFAYTRACQRRFWSHLRADTTLTIGTQRFGACTVTQGSPTVVPGIGAGALIFTSADVGRQFRVASLPIYTLIAFDPGTGDVTLDQPYQPNAGSTATLGTVLDVYVTMPEDFQEFVTVVDPVNKWRLRWWISEDDLNRWDPARQSTTSPVCLASNRLSTLPATAGQARYELWPYGLTARAFPVMYQRKPEILQDTSPFIGPFARQGMEIFLDGALARCALWPGLGKEKPNPYFNLALAKAHEASFLDALDTLATGDEDLYPTWKVYSQYDFARIPVDSAWMQSHDVSFADAL